MKQIVLRVQRRQYDRLGDHISLDGIRETVEGLGGEVLTIHTLGDNYEVRFRLWVSMLEDEEE